MEVKGHKFRWVKITIMSLGAEPFEIFRLNFHPLEAASRSRDPQLPVNEN